MTSTIESGYQDQKDADVRGRLQRTRGAPVLLGFGTKTWSREERRGEGGPSKRVCIGGGGIHGDVRFVFRGIQGRVELIVDWTIVGSTPGGIGRTT